MVHWHHHDKIKARLATAQFGSAFFGSELSLDHGLSNSRKKAASSGREEA